MLDQAKNTDLFCDYYSQWVSVYKEGAIRKVTLDKYLMTQSWLKKLIPEVKLCDMNRITYQAKEVSGEDISQNIFNLFSGTFFRNKKRQDRTYKVTALPLTFG